MSRRKFSRNCLEFRPDCGWECPHCRAQRAHERWWPQDKRKIAQMRLEKYFQLIRERERRWKRGEVALHIYIFPPYRWLSLLCSKSLHLFGEWDEATLKNAHFSVQMCKESWSKSHFDLFGPHDECVWICIRFVWKWNCSWISSFFRCWNCKVRSEIRENLQWKKRTNV